MNAYSHRWIAILIGVQALSLAIISPLHLGGVLGGGAKPFNPTAAGTAEAVIGIVLILGALALLRGTVRGRMRGGDAIDVAYHATMLPLLLLTLVALSRKRRRAAT
jgi:hypothetical protein